MRSSLGAPQRLRPQEDEPLSGGVTSSFLDSRKLRMLNKVEDKISEENEVQRTGVMLAHWVFDAFSSYSEARSYQGAAVANASQLLEYPQSAGIAQAKDFARSQLL